MTVMGAKATTAPELLWATQHGNAEVVEVLQELEQLGLKVGIQWAAVSRSVFFDGDELPALEQADQTVARVLKSDRAASVTVFKDFTGLSPIAQDDLRRKVAGAGGILVRRNSDVSFKELVEELRTPLLEAARAATKQVPSTSVPAPPPETYAGFASPDDDFDELIRSLAECEDSKSVVS